MMPDRRAFVVRKLHSLAGVVPIGAFLVEHVWTNAAALDGPAAYERAVGRIRSLPGLVALEWLFIFLPLAFHSFYGVWLTLRGRPNAVRYPYARNWLYVMQRATGVVALVFLAWHLYEFRVQTWLYGMRPVAFYGTLAAHLSATRAGVPLAALFYLLGLFASVFHFTNGMWGFCFSWGLTTSRAAQRRSAWVFAVLGAGLFALGGATVLHFATGAWFTGSSEGAAACP